MLQILLYLINIWLHLAYSDNFSTFIFISRSSSISISLPLPTYLSFYLYLSLSLSLSTILCLFFCIILFLVIRYCCRCCCPLFETFPSDCWCHWKIKLQWNSSMLFIYAYLVLICTHLNTLIDIELNRYFKFILDIPHFCVRSSLVWENWHAFMAWNVSNTVLAEPIFLCLIYGSGSKHVSHIFIAYMIGLRGWRVQKPMRNVD